MADVVAARNIEGIERKNKPSPAQEVEKKLSCLFFSLYVLLAHPLCVFVPCLF
jgi:hypothetical protein